MNRLVKDIKKCNKEKKRLLLELETVEKAIIKANSNISKAEDKCLEIQECNHFLRFFSIDWFNYFSQISTNYPKSQMKTKKMLKT